MTLCLRFVRSSKKGLGAWSALKRGGVDPSGTGRPAHENIANVVIVEARDRLGGRAHTHRLGDGTPGVCVVVFFFFFFIAPPSVE